MSTSSEFIYDQSLDSLLENLPLGSVRRAVANNLYGINFRQTGNAVPRAKDQYGFTFFTRPQLNLSTMNVTNYRPLYSLLNQNRASYQRYTRSILDPRLGRATASEVGSGVYCPFVDTANPFISTLTNNMVSLSGWPDLTVPVHTTESGLYGQEHSIVDGVTNHFEAFDLDVTFRNSRGNPLLYKFYVWIKYQSLVFEGIFNPYLDMVVENEIDYNTRIYRLVLDQQKRYVTQIACTGASFPINVPTGNLFDYSVDTPYNGKNAEINIRFRSMGFLAFDDAIKMRFNETVGIFNPDMRKVLRHDMASISGSDSVLRENPATVYRIADSQYVRVPPMLAMAADSSDLNTGLLAVNHRAVPYINLYTSELEWWVKESELSTRGNSAMQDAYAVAYSA